jgi:hypothetical protein
VRGVQLPTQRQIQASLWNVRRIEKFNYSTNQSVSLIRI